MSLSTMDKVKVNFVLQQLKAVESNTRRAMFNEIAKTFCLFCGRIVSECSYKGKPHG